MIGRYVILNMLIVPSIINQRFLPRATIESAHMRKSIVCVTYFDTLYLNKKQVFSNMFKIYCVFRDKLRAVAQNLIVHRVWREHAISNVYGITTFAAGWRLSENNYGAHWILPYREPGHHDMHLLLLIAPKLLQCHYSGKCFQNNGVSGCRMVFLYQLTASIAE